jgi:hypothetical protein
MRLDAHLHTSHHVPFKLRRMTIAQFDGMPADHLVTQQHQASSKIYIVQIDRAALFITPPQNLVIIAIVCGSTASSLLAGCGWTNNKLGLAWLKRFHQATKTKARRSWRLLICDGHGSHMTMEFLAYAVQKRILIMVFPSHSTHT